MRLKIHSNKKHRALGYYLSIVRDVITSPKMKFGKLYYADLFCGDGSCISDSGKEWKPTIIQSILEPAKDNKFPVEVFLNDMNPKAIESMKEKTKEFSQFVVDYGNEDANAYYKKALSKIPKNKFAIFFLDPTNHNELKWETIKGISEHANTSYGKTYRPEIIINLMTFTMCQSYRAKSYQSIDEALGTHEWFDEFKRNRTMGMRKPLVLALLNSFIRQLQQLGYYVPTPIPITNTFPSNTVYYLIWATNRNGYKVIENRVIPYLFKRVEELQAENVAEELKLRDKKRGITHLEDFFKTKP